MHVLMLTPALPYPPHQGGTLRNFGILKGLHDAGHQVTLVSFSDQPTNTGATPLAVLCERVEIVAPPARRRSDRVRDLILSGQPDLARRLESDGMRACLDAVLRDQAFDLIQIEGLEMAGYLAFVRHRQPHARVVYDAHNAEAALQRAIARVDLTEARRLPAALWSLVQARRIARLEREVVRTVDGVVAVSTTDAAALRPARPDGRIAVVPNGIFTADYTDERPRLDLGRHVLVFTGKMDYRPNVDAMLWFAADILPLVREQVPDVQLVIVGQKPHAKLDVLRDLPGIAITGWVAEVQPYLQAADVYIAPLRMGSGTRLKLLEALAAGCAVVATPAAASGLDDIHAALALADDALAFAAQTTALLRDTAARQTLGEHAKAAAARYDWSALMPCLLDAYRSWGIG